MPGSSVPTVDEPAIKRAYGLTVAYGDKFRTRKHAHVLLADKAEYSGDSVGGGLPLRLAPGPCFLTTF